MVVALMNTAFVYPKRPNLHLMAERGAGAAEASTSSSSSSVFLTGAKGIGSKNSEPYAAVM
jgi:hypothetical protein